MSQDTASSLPIIRGACGHDCPDTCGWMVTVRDGQAVRLEGNPAHPFTRGTLCAKVNHYLERVYHADRVLYPLKRIGPKGAGRFARTTWDEALATIADRWHSLMSREGPEAILPYSSAGNQGLIQMGSLDRRLCGAMGFSKLDRSICGEVAAAGLSATQGNGFGADPEDLVHSRYIVLWGTNTIVTNLHMWPIIREARARGAKIVVVDPIRTRTAAQADWHLQLRPASDAALAMAIMHVLVRDNLVDHEYVAQHASGYEELVERLRDYPPQAVAALCGLEAAAIEQFAREYATTHPAIIRPLIGLEHHRNGAMMFRTLACLPVLSGAWRRRGGGLCRSSHSLQFSTLNGSAVVRAEHDRPGVRTLNMRDLGDDLCSATLAPPIRSLCVYNANPAVSIPNQGQIVRGLQREDLFTVVHDLFITETARYADYVLPATSQIECLDLVPAWGHHYLALNRPAIEPRGESVANTELFRRLARALGRTEPWLYDSDETLVRTALDSSHPWLQGITFERLWEEGFVRLNPQRDWLPFAHGGFATPSGKALLYSAQLAAQGLVPLPSSGAVCRDPQHRLQLISGKTVHYLNSSYARIERHRQREGVLQIELNAHDARQRQLTSGDRVAVFNERGRLAAECCVSDRVPIGVAWMPFGGNSDAHGELVSVNALTPVEPTDWGGGTGFYDTFVEVERLRPAAD